MTARPSPEAPSTGASAPAARSLGGLARHSAIYSAAPIVRQGVSVGMNRFYTGWLGEAGYGIKEIADLWMIGFQQLLGQNALGAMVRFYFEHEDERERARVVSSTTIAVTAIAWLVCGALLLVSGPLTPVLLGEGGIVSADRLHTVLRLVLVLIPFQLASLSGFYWLQARERSTLYSGLQTGKLFLEVALNFWLIGALGLGVVGFLISMLVGEIVTTTLLTGSMLWTLRPRVDWGVLRPVLVYASPLITAGLCQLGLHHVDKRLLLHFADDAVAQQVTGIYGLGYRIGNIVNAMVIGSFLQIWQPWIFAVRDEHERAALVRRVSSYALFVFAAATLAVTAIGREAVLLLDSDGGFRAAWRVIPLVAGGYLFWGLYQVAHIPLLAIKRTDRVLALSAIALVANVGLNALLIPRLGFVGAGVATLATFALLAGLVMAASRITAGVRFELGRLGATFALVLVGAAVALAVDGLLLETGRVPLWAGLGLKLGTVTGLGLVLFGAILRDDERRDLAAWVRTKLPGTGGGTGG